MFSPFSLFILALIVNNAAIRIRQNMIREFSRKLCQARGIAMKATKEEKEKYMPNLFVYYLPSIIAIAINIIVAIQFYNL